MLEEQWGKTDRKGVDLRGQRGVGNDIREAYEEAFFDCELGDAGFGGMDDDFDFQFRGGRCLPACGVFQVQG